MKIQYLPILFGALALWQATSAQTVHKIQPLVGTYRKYTVRKGDTLYTISRRENVNRESLEKLNPIQGRQLKPGAKLLLPSLHILPRNLEEGIVLNIPERRVYIFKQNALVAHYPVAVGKADWQTATGTYRLARKVVNPEWVPPKAMVEREDIKDDPVPPGADNPLGDRWMGWSKSGFGFHSTIAPQSVGKAASHGCVRLYPDAARRMFDQVKEGMSIYSVYEPVEVGERDGKFYLSVFPDIYNKGQVSLAQAQKRLEQEGLLPLVDTHTLLEIERKADGYPHRIVGSDLALMVNGQQIHTSIRPTQAAGHWIVPVKEVVAALNGTVEPENGLVKITNGAHTLKLKPGQSEATLDGKPITLPVPPVLVKETLLAPVSVLCRLFAATVTEKRGQALDIEARAVAP